MQNTALILFKFTETLSDMLIIESARNETFRKILGLTTSKGLRKEGLLLLSGEKLVHEYLKNPHLPVAYEIRTEAMPSLDSHIRGDGAEFICLAPGLFDQVDILGTHYNILVLHQPPVRTLNTDETFNYRPTGLEVATPTGDPGNLGALLRSCEAFGVRSVLLTAEAAHPFLPKTIKASAGSALRISLTHTPALQFYAPECLALDMSGVSIDEFVWPDNGLLLVGEEGQGLGHRTDYFRNRIRIPTSGVESLNVVVAASIALRHNLLQRQS